MCSKIKLRLLAFAAVMFLSGCSAEKYPDGMIVTGEESDGKTTVSVSAEGKLRTAYTLVKGVDYFEGAVISAEDFADIMGCSGRIISVTSGERHTTEAYCINDGGKLKCIAEGFGFGNPESFSRDLDGDGTYELVCNNTFGGNGVRMAYIYQRRDDGIYVASADNFISADDYDASAAGMPNSAYNAEKNVFELTFVPKGGTETVTREFEPSIGNLFFEPYVPKILSE